MFSCVHTALAVLIISVGISALTSNTCVINGLSPDDTDCARFYMCSPSGAVLFECPSGLHFNPTAEYCDWPDLAGCILTPTTDPTITAETNTSAISRDENANVELSPILLQSEVNIPITTIYIADGTDNRNNTPVNLEVISKDTTISTLENHTILIKENPTDGINSLSDTSATELAEKEVTSTNKLHVVTEVTNSETVESNDSPAESQTAFTNDRSSAILTDTRTDISNVDETPVQSNAIDLAAVTATGFTESDLTFADNLQRVTDITNLKTDEPEALPSKTSTIFDFTDDHFSSILSDAITGIAESVVSSAETEATYVTDDYSSGVFSDSKMETLNQETTSEIATDLTDKEFTHTDKLNLVADVTNSKTIAPTVSPAETTFTDDHSSSILYDSRTDISNVETTPEVPSIATDLVDVVFTDNDLTPTENLHIGTDITNTITHEPEISHSETQTTYDFTDDNSSGILSEAIIDNPTLETTFEVLPSITLEIDDIPATELIDRELTTTDNLNIVTDITNSEGLTLKITTNRVPFTASQIVETAATDLTNNGVSSDTQTAYGFTDDAITDNSNIGKTTDGVSSTTKISDTDETVVSPTESQAIYTTDDHSSALLFDSKTEISDLETTSKDIPSTATEIAVATDVTDTQLTSSDNLSTITDITDLEPTGSDVSPSESQATFDIIDDHSSAISYAVTDSFITEVSDTADHINIVTDITNSDTAVSDSSTAETGTTYVTDGQVLSNSTTEISGLKTTNEGDRYAASYTADSTATQLADKELTPSGDFTMVTDITNSEATEAEVSPSEAQTTYDFIDNHSSTLLSDIITGNSIKETTTERVLSSETEEIDTPATELTDKKITSINNLNIVTTKTQTTYVTDDPVFSNSRTDISSLETTSERVQFTSSDLTATQLTDKELTPAGILNMVTDITNSEAAEVDVSHSEAETTYYFTNDHSSTLLSDVITDNSIQETTTERVTSSASEVVYTAATDLADKEITTDNTNSEAAEAEVSPSKAQTTYDFIDDHSATLLSAVITDSSVQETTTERAQSSATEVVDTAATELRDNITSTDNLTIVTDITNSETTELEVTSAESQTIFPTNNPNIGTVTESRNNEKPLTTEMSKAFTYFTNLEIIVNDIQSTTSYDKTFDGVSTTDYKVLISSNNPFTDTVGNTNDKDIQLPEVSSTIEQTTKLNGYTSSTSGQNIFTNKVVYPIKPSHAVEEVSSDYVIHSTESIIPLFASTILEAGENVISATTNNAKDTPDITESNFVINNTAASVETNSSPANDIESHQSNSVTTIINNQASNNVGQTVVNEIFSQESGYSTIEEISHITENGGDKSNPKEISDVTKALSTSTTETPSYTDADKEKNNQTVINVEHTTPSNESQIGTTIVSPAVNLPMKLTQKPPYEAVTLNNSNDQEDANNYFNENAEEDKNTYNVHNTADGVDEGQNIVNQDDRESDNEDDKYVVDNDDGLGGEDIEGMYSNENNDRDGRDGDDDDDDDDDDDSDDDDDDDSDSDDSESNEIYRNKYGHNRDRNRNRNKDHNNRNNNDRNNNNRNNNNRNNNNRNNNNNNRNNNNNNRKKNKEGMSNERNQNRNTHQNNQSREKSDRNSTNRNRHDQQQRNNRRYSNESERPDISQYLAYRNFWKQYNRQNNRNGNRSYE